MRKKILGLLLLTNISCATYLDDGQNIHNSLMKFNYYENNNNLKYISSINSSADNDTYYTTKFSVNLPKKIKYWIKKNNEFYFEYPNKQIIYIYSGYQNNGEKKKWIINDVDNAEIHKRLDKYWDIRRFSRNNFSIKENRVSKVYTDGNVVILLFNIKKNNFNVFLASVQTFEYLNSDR